jgi:PEP-CTERM motif
MSTDMQLSTPCAQRHGTRLAFSAVLLASALVMSPQAWAASIGQVGSLAALGANDAVQWNGDGDDIDNDYDDGDTVSSPYEVSSTGGIAVTASAMELTLYEQYGGGGFTANFTEGDKLLTTGFADGPLTLSFSTPVRGVGFQIVNQNPGSFTGTIEFFNAANLSLGVLTTLGTSSFDNDGSAAFLGGVGNLLEISKVSISVSKSYDGFVDLEGTSLAINQLNLVTTPVPEPTSALLLALGLAGLGLHLRRGAATRA